METFREQSEDIQLRVTEMLMDSRLSVIVEGRHDKLTLERFFDDKYCSFEQFNGKEKAEMAIQLVNAVDPTRAIAILDHDLDFLDSKSYPSNVFLTDGHDLDIQLFFSDAFYRVAREYFSEEETSTKTKLNNIRKTIVTFARPLAYMRVVSKEKGYDFAFKASKEHNKPFPYKNLVQVDNKTCKFLGDEKTVQTACCYRNQGKGKDQKLMLADVRAIAKRNYSDKELLHGHDLMNFFGLVVAYYGPASSSSKNVDDIECSFRLTYSNEFYKTTLYEALKKYCEYNKKPILAS